MQECKNARMQECKNARMQEFKNEVTKICKYASVQVCKYANMQEGKNASMQVCKYARKQVCKYADIFLVCVSKVSSMEFWGTFLIPKGILDNFDVLNNNDLECKHVRIQECKCASMHMQI